MSDTEKFLFATWPVEVHRRPFRRSVSIYLKPQKPIKVVASKTTSQKVILDFLLAKKSWIEKNLQKFEEQLALNPAKKIVALEKFPYLGVDRTLRIVITFQKKPFISVAEEDLLLHIPRDEWDANTVWIEHPYAQEQLRHFYKREAIKDLAKRVQFWSEKMNLYPTQVKLREQRTRWGSCTSRGVINLNWRLVVFPPQIIDYVVIHELAHLKHMNHSANFWNLVEAYMPDYRVHMKVLKESQGRVEFLNQK